MTTQTSKLFESITVDATTGTIAYPKVEGFTLDIERVYSTAALFMPHCGNLAMAVRHAIHQQIVAFIGLQRAS